MTTPIEPPVQAPETRPLPRPSPIVIALTFVAFLAALPMTLLGGVFVLVTVAGNDYGPMMIRAIGLATGSALLLLACWRRLDLGRRIFAIVLIVADVLVVLEAVPRL